MEQHTVKVDIDIAVAIEPQGDTRARIVAEDSFEGILGGLSLGILELALASAD